MNKVASNFYKFEMKEGTKYHEYLVDTYNLMCTPLARGYAMKYTDAWCATFVSVCAFMAGYDRVLYECSASKQYSKVIRRYEHGNHRLIPPVAGDLVYYSMKKNGYIDHVGIIIDVDDKLNLTVLEGNKNNKIGKRVINLSSDLIFDIVRCANFR